MEKCTIKSGSEMLLVVHLIYRRVLSISQLFNPGSIYYPRTYTQAMRRLLPVFEVSRHGVVEAIKVGRFNIATNTSVYAFRIGDTLIDTGCPSAEDSIRKYVRARKGIVKQALASHFHEGKETRKITELRASRSA